MQIKRVYGADVISMVIFHFSFDMYIVYGRDVTWYSRPQIHIWQQSICWIFILISGFVWRLGKKGNLKRGIMLNVFGFIITAVTLIFMPDEAVWFGILNFIGWAVLIMIPVESGLKKIPPAAGAISSFVLFIFLKNIQHGYVGFYDLIKIKVPEIFYDIKVLTPLGFPYAGFSSSDYFPILPWIFLYICGYFLYGLFQKSEALKRAASVRIPLLTQIGQAALWIYLIHQPLAILMCEVLLDIKIF